MADLTKIAEDLSSLTGMEAADLSKLLEEKWGVSAAAPVAAVIVPTTGGEAEAEKSEFDVILASTGEKKIEVIKAVRAITGLGLTEAKAVVDGTPSAVKQGVSKADAADIKAKLEAAGATVEVK